MNQIITWGISIGALALSITTIIITRKNVKKQLRLTKLEEILEILNFLSNNYYHLYWLTNQLEDLELDKADFTKRVEELFAYVGKENFQNKLSRLGILASAYLPNKSNENLQLKIHGLINLFSLMASCVVHTDFSLKKEHYAEGLARPKKLILFINHIEQSVIKEMNLGYKKVTLEEMRKYREKKFKIDLKIIDG